MKDITPVEALYDKSPATLIAFLTLVSVKYKLVPSLILVVDFPESLVSKSVLNDV